MSERHSSFLKYRGCYLCIAAAILLLFALFFAFRTRPEKKAVLRIKRLPSSSMVPRVEKSIKPPVFDSESYYRTIIDNNLFRPLGWSPPVRVEPYRLVGTIFPRDKNRPAQAIIEPVSGGTPHFVGVGDAIEGETMVVSIQAKSVTLETAGQSRTLSLETGVFLNAKRSSVGVDRQKPPEPHARVVSRGVGPKASGVSVSRGVPVGSRAKSAERQHPYSGWQTVEGERLRVGDARLKNPVKWRLRRR